MSITHDRARLAARARGPVLGARARSSPRAATTTSGGGGGGVSERRKKNYKMTLIAGVKGDEFYITMNCGAQAKAKELGVTLDFQGPEEFDAAQQTPIVNAVAAKKPDAVLIAPTDTKALYAPIKQLADAGHEDRARRHHARAARHGGVADRLRQRGRRQDRGRRRCRADRRQGQGVRRSTSSRASRPRTRARRASWRAPRQPGSTTSGASTPTTSPRTAAAKIKAALPKNPDLKGIFATNLFSAEGAASGVREAGAEGQDRRLRRRPEAGQGPQGRASCRP